MITLKSETPQAFIKDNKETFDHFEIQVIKNILNNYKGDNMGVLIGTFSIDAIDKMVKFLNNTL